MSKTFTDTCGNKLRIFMYSKNQENIFFEIEGEEDDFLNVALKKSQIKFIIKELQSIEKKLK